MEEIKVKAEVNNSELTEEEKKRIAEEEKRKEEQRKHSTKYNIYVSLSNMQVVITIP